MLETVRDRARPYFEDAPPAHDWHHVRRVAALADTLVAKQTGSADERIVQLAVALHDIGREREDRGEIDDHAAWGAREGSRILADVGASEETIEHVRHCIGAHRYSNDVEPETLEAEIVCDADNLDALGAVGIARAFAHGSVIGSPLYDPDVPPAEDETVAGRSQYNHFYKKILELPERMYTDAGRDLAADRATFAREYLERFEAEAAGEA
ncbi:HD domain-containing protein [Natronococcus sp. A-GB1]|uniref:HD domain-containing protein n=1 Tax=Natronococcus sp. A-GB1 TaxID=3037648 RepID=UPI00241D7932|nr:HD domain-containing protein [Natronococcus sp. A-GB1]MDG5757897.1 HD domain-containing protein [Natronococcus sp. A-GB1]